LCDGRFLAVLTGSGRGGIIGGGEWVVVARGDERATTDVQERISDDT